VKVSKAMVRRTQRNLELLVSVYSVVRTGGHWVNKCWVPDSVKSLDLPQSNMDFKSEPWSWRFGTKKEATR